MSGPILTRCVMAVRHQEVNMASKKANVIPDPGSNRAVKAGRKALREAEKRVPPDVRRQIEQVDQGRPEDVSTRRSKTSRRASTRPPRQADVDTVLKRLDGLSKQVVSSPAARDHPPAGGGGHPPDDDQASNRPQARRPQAAATRRKPATRTGGQKPAARKSAASKAATAARKPAAPTPRGEACSDVWRADGPHIAPSVPEAPGPIPTRVEPGGDLESETRAPPRSTALRAEPIPSFRDSSSGSPRRPAGRRASPARACP